MEVADDAAVLINSGFDGIAVVNVQIDNGADRLIGIEAIHRFEIIDGFAFVKKLIVDTAEGCQISQRDIRVSCRVIGTLPALSVTAGSAPVVHVHRRKVK